MKKVIRKLQDYITPSLRLIYLADPSRFVREVLFGKRAKELGGNLFITDQQEEILLSVAKSKAISVRAGRGIGKTAVLSWIILWWICVMPNTKVVATAPSFPQLQSVLWPEVAMWMNNSRLKHYLTWTRKRLYRNDNALSFAEPRTASKEEAAQGLHNGTLLIIADEATGIEDGILTTLAGSLTGTKNKMIMMFNPTRISGFAYDSHHRDKARWSVHHFSSEDSPVVDKDMVDRWRAKYVSGNTIHDMYRMHIMGDFPNGDPKALFTIEELYAARDRTVPKSGPVEIGLDFAAEGDDSTVFCARWGGYVLTSCDLGQGDEKELGLVAWGKTKITESFRKIKELIWKTREFTKFGGQIVVKGDNGGLGVGIIHLLEECEVELNIKVIPVNFNGSGKNYEEDKNEATHMWFTVKDMIDSIQLPYDNFLLEEMGTRQWEPDEISHKKKIESKRKFKKRYKSSPDRADALILAFAKCEGKRNFVASYSEGINRHEIAQGELERIGDKYCGIHCTDDGKMSVVLATIFNGSVGVYDTIEGSISEVLDDRRMRDFYTMTIGSKNMFGLGSNTVAMKMYRAGFSLIPPMCYDEIGSAYTIDLLAKSGKFIVAKECISMKRQLTTWTTDKNMSTLRESNSLCFALTLIISSLVTLNQLQQSKMEDEYLGYGKFKNIVG